MYSKISFKISFALYKWIKKGEKNRDSIRRSKINFQSKEEKKLKHKMKNEKAERE